MVASNLRTAVLVGAFALSACTFTGLDDYRIDTCARPLGTSSELARIGTVSDLGFSSASGKDPLAAFAAVATGGTCVQAVGASGALDSTCSFLADETSLAPHHPTVVPLSVGRGAAFVATTAPCTDGALEYRFAASTVVGKASLPCEPKGAALPAIAPATEGTVLVAWYQTPFSTRADPIASCAAATPAALQVATISEATGGTPKLGAPAVLDAAGIGVRPPAMVRAADQSVVLAAPVTSGVAVWSLRVDGTAPPTPVMIPALVGARAVSVALADDGSNRIAIAAEIGCAPQSIAVVVGTLAGGFSAPQTVAAADGNLAVGPSLAWIASQKRWVVAWISTTDGAHVLARSFDGTTSGLGAVLDPRVSAVAAAATADGSVLAFSSGTGGLTQTSLGCRL